MFGGEGSPLVPTSKLFYSTPLAWGESPSPSACLTTDLATIGTTFFEECPFYRMMDKYGDKQAFRYRLKSIEKLTSRVLSTLKVITHA